MSNILVISPHLDDAVLSCGAQIAQWVAHRHQVAVATVFNHPDVHAGEAMEQHYEQRIKDDEAALQSLGALAIYLNFADAPFRDAQYHNFNTLLFHHTLTEEAKAVADTLGPVLKMVADDVEADVIYFPLGIGGHIDHMLVFESSKVFWRDSIKVHYYEELPYAMVPGWSSVRRLKSNSRQHFASPVSLHNEHPRLKDLPLAFVQNYMENDDDLQQSELKYADQWKALQKHMPADDAWVTGDFTLTREIASLAREYFEKKCTAIQHYKSEWPTLFGEQPDSIQQTLSAALNGDVYTEISWKLNR